MGAPWLASGDACTINGKRLKQTNIFEDKHLMYRRIRQSNAAVKDSEFLAFQLNAIVGPFPQYRQFGNHLPRFGVTVDVWLPRDGDIEPLPPGEVLAKMFEVAYHAAPNLSCAALESSARRFQPRMPSHTKRTPCFCSKESTACLNIKLRAKLRTRVFPRIVRENACVAAK